MRLWVIFFVSFLHIFLIAVEEEKWITRTKFLLLAPTLNAWKTYTRQPVRLVKLTGSTRGSKLLKDIYLGSWEDA